MDTVEVELEILKIVEIFCVTIFQLPWLYQMCQFLGGEPPNPSPRAFLIDTVEVDLEILKIVKIHEET